MVCVCARVCVDTHVFVWMCVLVCVRIAQYVYVKFVRTVCVYEYMGCVVREYLCINMYQSVKFVCTDYASACVREWNARCDIYDFLRGGWVWC